MSTHPGSAGVCDYCGLPLPRAWWGGTARDDSHQVAAQYCCFGCRFAANVAHERGEAGKVNWSLARLGLSIFFTMHVMVFTMALWSSDLYPDAAAGGHRLTSTFFELFRYACLVFSLPVLLLLGGPVLEEAWQGLRRRVITIDVLMIAGVLAAYLASAAAVLRGRGNVYFEVGCIVLVLVSLGRWLLATARVKALHTLDALEKLLPLSGSVVRGNEELAVPLAEIEPGDVLRVRPGDRFPADGCIIDRFTTVDEQLFTGESWPAVRGPGDRVLGGTLNIDGEVLVRVTAASAGGTFARLVAAVRSARETRTRYETLADRVTSWFVPAVAVIALAAFGFHAVTHGIQEAVLVALSVVLIACPCALGLATPLAVWSAMAAALRKHVLFRNGDALEKLARVRAIRFDKTGTLTTGLPTVQRLVCDNADEQTEITRLAAALVRGSTHAFSRAVAEFTKVVPASLAVGAIHALAGRGLEGTLSNTAAPVVLGSRRWIDELGWQIPEQLVQAAETQSQAGNSISLIGWDRRIRGLFVFRESLRADAEHVVGWANRAGFDVGILTGDHPIRGEQLSRQLNVPVRAGLLPDEKSDLIRQISAAVGPVAMIGDGINDAAALAQADVGIALGCGTDITRETADVCLLGNDLATLPWLWELSRKTRHTIRWNLVWAFGYNIVGVAMAARGWLSPPLAALIMTVSSLCVVANSLRVGCTADKEWDAANPADVATPVNNADPLSRTINPAGEIPLPAATALVPEPPTSTPTEACVG